MIERETVYSRHIDWDWFYSSSLNGLYLLHIYSWKRTVVRHIYLYGFNFLRWKNKIKWKHNKNNRKEKRKIEDENQEEKRNKKEVKEY